MSTRRTARPIPFAALRRFAEWWVDEARSTPCCQWATDEDINGDPDQYDCETCSVRRMLGSLDEGNARAWRVYQAGVTRLAHEWGCGAEVLRRLTGEVSEDEWPGLWDRLNLLHDVLRPPEKGGT